MAIGKTLFVRILALPLAVFTIATCSIGVEAGRYTKGDAPKQEAGINDDEYREQQATRSDRKGGGERLIWERTVARPVIPPSINNAHAPQATKRGLHSRIIIWTPLFAEGGFDLIICTILK